MMEEVHNKCHEHGIEIIADCMDGEWPKIHLCDIKGNPLTRLQFQKDCSAKVCKENKAALVEGLVKYCKVEEKDIKEMSQCMFL